MPDEDRRRLAALMLTDLVGYTSLCQRNESLALEVLREHTQIVRAEVSRHAGREIKCTGDGYLVEFPSVLAALECAVAIQRAVDRRNAAVPDEKAFHLRIGLHVGDVVDRGGDLFGDGVNLVARIEPLAPPGGICTSQQVYDQVWNKTEERLVYAGTESLKGLEHPTKIYRVTRTGDPSRRAADRGANRRRIAVLPLMNISPDPADAYFTDGMTDELICTLAQHPELKVIAHTSVLRYRGATKSIAEIREELGVGTIVEGSVRKVGDRIRISLQLIDSQSEEHLWAHAYDGVLGDVFAFQADVASHVAHALQLLLGEGGPRPVRREPTHNIEAYTLYLKGRYLWNRRTEADLWAAIGCFARAAELDPRFALAHVGLADAYNLLPEYGTLSPQDAHPNARAAALRALELDESLAEAHASLGMVCAHQSFDFAAAQRELRRAIELNPNYATAHHWYALVLMYIHRLDEALRAIDRALELDPLSLVVNRNLGRILLAARRTDEAIAAFGRVLALDPSFPMTRVNLALAYVQKGDLQHALAAVEGERSVRGGSPWPAVIAGCLREMSGERGAVAAALRELESRAAREHVPPTCFAACYLAIGELERSLAWLERAYAERDEWLLTALTTPFVDPVRSDPRFGRLAAQVRGS
ncbi:tetratricopeptide repeat protein [Candidatus Bipolaricaulota bacterium]|nr:tetratricopeptide repeat protein [Candidatus Bipolaricaulota bacterium]